MINTILGPESVMKSKVELCLKCYNDKQLWTYFEIPDFIASRTYQTKGSIYTIIKMSEKSIQ